VRVFSSVDGRALACEGQQVGQAVRAPSDCVPAGTASVHLARGPLREGARSLDSPAMWGHPEWMKHVTGSVWTHARSWHAVGDYVFIFERTE
jgi:hypothetical protein